MPRPLRHMPRSHTVFLITNRCVQKRFLLKPSKLLKAIILGVIGRAQSLFPEIRIYSFKFASNHYHIILSAPDVETLSAFMNHINSNIAREAGRLHDWQDKFWSRRYRATPILDDTSLIRETRYVLSHGCKEGLVGHPQEWPGASCERALLSSEKLEGVWYDRSAFCEAERKGNRDVRLEQFTCRYEVRLSRLPCLADMSEEQVRDFYREMVADIEQETRGMLQAEGKRPLGVHTVLNIDPHNRPKKSKKSPAPWCHASTRKAKDAYLSAYRAFVSVYREAVDRLRRGEREVQFPENCFLPSFAARNDLVFSAAPG